MRVVRWLRGFSWRRVVFVLRRRWLAARPVRVGVGVRVVETSRRGIPGGVVRVAVVGLGNIATSVHLPVLSSSGKFRVVYVVSSNLEKAVVYGRLFGASFATTDYDVVLGDPRVDAVVVCTQNVDHAARVVEAVRHGKHVMVEKPVGLSVGECERVRGAVRRSGRVCGVVLNRRFSPVSAVMREWLRRRKGSCVVYYRLSVERFAERSWKDEQGGSIVDRLCHVFDWVEWVLGARVVSLVSASCVEGLVGDRALRGEDNVVVVARLSDGSLLNVVHTTLGNAVHGGEVVHVYRGRWVYSMRDFREFSVCDGEGVVFEKKFRVAEKGYREQWGCFADCVRGGCARRGDFVTVEDGIRATMWCLRVREALGLGG